MKPTPYLIALALATAPTAMCGEAGSTVAKLTFRLTESMTSPSLLAKDGDGRRIKGADRVYENSYTRSTSNKTVETEEYGSKIQKSKISNKEILEALRDAGAIPAISGWSIVVINGGNSVVKVSGGYVAATNGSTYIQISDYIQIYSQQGSAEAAYTKSVTTTKDDNSTTKNTGKRKGKQRVHIRLNFPDSSARLEGISNWSETYKTFGRGEEAYSRWIPGSSKISCIAGYNYSGSSSAEGAAPKAFGSSVRDSLIEGSISSSGAKLEEVNIGLEPT